jgi:hypothetical protein
MESSSGHATFESLSGEQRKDRDVVEKFSLVNAGMTGKYHSGIKFKGGLGCARKPGREAVRRSAGQCDGDETVSGLMNHDLWAEQQQRHLEKNMTPGLFLAKGNEKIMVSQFQGKF